MKNDKIRELIFSILLQLSKGGLTQLPCESVLSSLIDTAKTQLQEEPFCINLSGRFIVVGDLHGDIETLIRIFERMGYPPTSNYLFLGDFIDRGHYSIEVMTLLLSLKVLFPQSIYLLRGNHETRNISKSHGFYAECSRKMNKNIYKQFCSLFDQLPLVAVINNKVYCAHGGISKGAMDMCDVYLLQKPVGKIKDQIITDILWSDPSDLTEDFEESERGTGHVFGEKALDSFLKQNGYSTIIRGHQTCENGYDQPFENNKCWTVFSSADYCNNWNTAAVLVVEDDEVVDIIRFDPLTEEEKKRHRIILPEWLLEFDEPLPCPMESNVFIPNTFFDDFNLLIDPVAL